MLMYIKKKRNVLQASLKGGNCDANVPYMRYRLTQDGTPVGSDVDFDKDEDHLYVIAGKKVGYMFKNFKHFSISVLK